MSLKIRADQGRVVPWRNGLGTTRELVRVPDNDGWDWRLTLATSTSCAPFSTFPGIDRELLLLRGEALALRFRGARTTRLVPGERTRFPGESPVTGVPTRGATQQLNLMWRRDSIAADTGLGDLPLTPAPATWLVMHVLGTGETTIFTNAEPPTVPGDGTVFWARLSARRGR